MKAKPTFIGVCPRLLQEGAKGPDPEEASGKSPEVRCRGRTSRVKLTLRESHWWGWSPRGSSISVSLDGALRFLDASARGLLVPGGRLHRWMLFDRAAAGGPASCRGTGLDTQPGESRSNHPAHPSERLLASSTRAIARTRRSHATPLSEDPSQPRLGRSSERVVLTSRSTAVLGASTGALGAPARAGLERSSSLPERGWRSFRPARAS